MKLTKKQLKQLIESLLYEIQGPDLMSGGDEGSLDFKSEDFLEEVLEKVISGKPGGGKSKNYTDLFYLDGGTVGIAHFAARGLGSLYEAMGDNIIKKHFSQYNADITSVQAIKDATAVGSKRDGYCRLGSEKAVDGTCWASIPWWKKGMKSFLDSSESKRIQNIAWRLVTVKPADKVMDVYSGDWHTKRGRAIGYCLVNSGGPGLLKRYSKNGELSPNETMELYSKDIGRLRPRFIMINNLYPDPNFVPTYKPEKYN